jgi:hypothetical protein
MLSFRTKSEWILALYKDGLSTKEIAEIVGCLPSYVRVVARQRKGTSASEIDRRYLTSSLGRSTRQKIDAKCRPYKLAYARVAEQTGNKDAANAAARAAVRAALRAGKSKPDADRCGKSVRSNVLIRTCDQEAARIAGRAALAASRQFNLQPTEAIHEHA